MHTTEYYISKINLDEKMGNVDLVKLSIHEIFNTTLFTNSPIIVQAKSDKEKRAIAFHNHIGCLDVYYDKCLFNTLQFRGCTVKEFDPTKVLSVLRALSDLIIYIGKYYLIEQTDINICLTCLRIVKYGERCDCCDIEKIDSPDENLVYFLRADDKVKIGYVSGYGLTSIYNRIAQLKTGICARDIELIHYEPGGKKREIDLHDKFKNYRLRQDGEWFYLTDEIKNHIKNCQEVTQ